MSEPELKPSTKFDWLLIGLLVLLVLPLRLWLLHNTEVAARDSISYVQYALEFEKANWKEVLSNHQQHPGYPVAVWLMSVPVRAIDGPATPANMALCTQLVSLVASLLLMLPMYWLGRQFFDRKVSFGATLLYQFLPISAQHLSDGIAEPLYLLLILSGLLQAVHAVQDRGLGRSILCGFFAGLAYLTRPEGVFILAAFASVFITLQFRAAWRCSWQRFLACGTAMMLAAMLTGSVYVIATGRITNKPSFNNLWLRKSAEVGPAQWQEPSRLAGGSHVLFAMIFPRTDSKVLRLQRSVWALMSELNQGFHYVAGIPALLGLWWSFNRLRLNPGFWVVAAYSLLHSFTLIALAMSASYVSDRHVMILVMFGCYFVVFGLCELPRRILVWRKIEADNFAWPTCWRFAPAWSAVLMVGLIAFSLPKATQRLHGNRAGNHAAGLWLAKQIQKGDDVFDDYDWSSYFSGLFLQTRQESQHVPTCYIVTTPGRGPQTDNNRRTVVLRPEAKVVYTWPEESVVEKARLVVYAQPREP